MIGLLLGLAIATALMALGYALQFGGGPPTVVEGVVVGFNLVESDQGSYPLRV